MDIHFHPPLFERFVLYFWKGISDFYFFRKNDKEWKIDDYIVSEFLGKGKFGLVYKAFHKDSQTEVALKILSKEAIKSYNMVKQLRREIEIHSRLK